MAKSARRVALLCIDPWQVTESEDNRPFNYAVRRIQAAILGHPKLSFIEQAMIESNSLDVEALAARIEAFNPDLIGVSAYVWSFPTMLEVCRRAKLARPDRTIIFGGPSARPEMFQLPQHRDGSHVVDAIVTGDGEACIQEILLAPDQERDTLLKIPGMSVYTSKGWTSTGHRDYGRPDAFPSPYQMGLMPSGVTAQFETFRGCPLSCTYCEWGDTGVTPRHFGYEHIVAELKALMKLDAKGTWLIDPGLNLNSRSFRYLQQAEAEVGALKAIGQLRCEIYPSHVTDEHLKFLQDTSAMHVGIGLQSFDAEVLKGVERPFNEDRFNTVVSEVGAIVPGATVEIIMGLPGDNPDNFKRTLEKVRKLPVGVRAFHCLVLPNALMTRAPASFDLKYDPFTLQVISCRGWTRKDLEKTRQWLDDIAYSEDKEVPHGATWRFYRPDAPPRNRPMAPDIHDAPMEIQSRPPREEVIPHEMRVVLQRIIGETAGWKLSKVEAIDADVYSGLVLFIEGASTLAAIRITPAQPGRPSYRQVDSIAYSYEKGASAPTRESLAELNLAIARLHPVTQGVLLGMTNGNKPAVRALPVIASGNSGELIRDAG